MKIKGRPLLIAAFVGFAVQAVPQVLGQLVLPQVDGGMLTFFITPATGVPGGSRGLAFLSTILPVLGCLCQIAVGLGVGLLYAYLAGRAEPLTAGDGALGGGVAGAIEGVFNGVFGVVLTAILLPGLAGFFSNVPQGSEDQVMLGGRVGELIGAVLGICIAIVVGAVLAAVGGALGASIFRPKAAAPSL